MRALIRQVLNTSDLADPNELAHEVQAAIPAECAADALAQALPIVVRNEISLN